MEITIKKTKDGNPSKDISDALTEARKRLNGNAKNGIIYSVKPTGTEIIIKIRTDEDTI